MTKDKKLHGAACALFLLLILGLAWQFLNVVVSVIRKGLPAKPAFHCPGCAAAQDLSDFSFIY